MVRSQALTFDAFVAAARASRSSSKTRQPSLMGCRIIVQAARGTLT